MAPKTSRRHLITALIAIVVVIGVITILAKGLSLDPTKVPSALIGKPAHDFSVSWLQGQGLVPNADQSALKLSDFKGRPIILNFWASWCVSCREEAVHFEQFWQKHRNEDLVVIGVAIQDTRDAAMEFARYYGKTYILGMDSSEGRTSIDYGVYGVPETFLIDRQGIIRYKEAGPMNAKQLDEHLPKIL